MAAVSCRRMLAIAAWRRVLQTSGYTQQLDLCLHISDLSCLLSSLKPRDSGPRTPTLLLWGITALMPDKTNQIKRGEKKECPSNPGTRTASVCFSSALKTANFPIKDPAMFASHVSAGCCAPAR